MERKEGVRLGEDKYFIKEVFEVLSWLRGQSFGIGCRYNYNN